MLIAILNNSTMVKDADLQIICAALQIQLDLHVLPAFDLKSGTVRFYSDPNTVPGYAWKVNVLDNTTQAGVLGYHDQNPNGKIEGFVFAQPILSNGGVVFSYDEKNPQQYTISATLSHEILEIIGDRFCGLWVDGPQIAQGSEYCLELCDPVENDSYPIEINGVQVAVSNFIFPSWTNPDAKVPDNLPFDYMNKLTKPFTMTSGGYMIVRNGPGTEQQIFGEKMPCWRRETKKSQFSRASKRI